MKVILISFFLLTSFQLNAGTFQYVSDTLRQYFSEGRYWGFDESNTPCSVKVHHHNLNEPQTLIPYQFGITISSFQSSSKGGYFLNDKDNSEGRGDNPVFIKHTEREIIVENKWWITSSRNKVNPGRLQVMKIGGELFFSISNYSFTENFSKSCTVRIDE